MKGHLLASGEFRVSFEEDFRGLDDDDVPWVVLGRNDDMISVEEIGGIPQDVLLPPRPVSFSTLRKRKLQDNEMSHVEIMLNNGGTNRGTITRVTEREIELDDTVIYTRKAVVSMRRLNHHRNHISTWSLDKKVGVVRCIFRPDDMKVTLAHALGLPSRFSLNDWNRVELSLLLRYHEHRWTEPITISSLDVSTSGDEPEATTFAQTREVFAMAQSSAPTKLDLRVVQTYDLKAPVRMVGEGAIVLATHRVRMTPLVVINMRDGATGIYAQFLVPDHLPAVILPGAYQSESGARVTFPRMFDVPHPSDGQGRPELGQLPGAALEMSEGAPIEVSPVSTTRPVSGKNTTAHTHRAYVRSTRPGEAVRVLIIFPLYANETLARETKLWNSYGDDNQPAQALLDMFHLKGISKLYYMQGHVKSERNHLAPVNFVRENPQY